MQLDPHHLIEVIEAPRHQTPNFDIKKETISTTRKETSFGMERIHAVAYATYSLI